MCKNEYNFFAIAYNNKINDIKILNKFVIKKTIINKIHLDLLINNILIIKIIFDYIVFFANLEKISYIFYKNK